VTPEAERELLEVAQTVSRVLEHMPAPAYLVDGEGVFRWLNKRAVDLIGDAVGRRFATVVAPDQLHLARCEFAKKLIGSADCTDYTLTVVSRGNGRVKLRITSSPLRNGGERVIGVFGLAYPVEGEDAPVLAAHDGGLHDALTPRQHEVLRLLARGTGTTDIATSLGVAEETARNHIRRLLGKLGVHSRLAAVAVGRERGLI
jgi:DNA-binding CsgD family transcriptional regulator